MSFFGLLGHQPPPPNPLPISWDCLPCISIGYGFAVQADLWPLSCPVLIRLKKKGDRCAVRSQFVQPICLPEAGSSFPTGHKCQIAGWGHMDESEWGGGPRCHPGVGQGTVSLPVLRVWYSTDVSEYSSSLREALVPLVADHKCSSPEVYGADISPNMLCAGYFDCKSDACQVGCCPAPTRTTQMGSSWDFLAPGELEG